MGKSVFRFDRLAMVLRPLYRLGHNTCNLDGHVRNGGQATEAAHSPDMLSFTAHDDYR